MFRRANREGFSVAFDLVPIGKRQRLTLLILADQLAEVLIGTVEPALGHTLLYELPPSKAVVARSASSRAPCQFPSPPFWSAQAQIGNVQVEYDRLTAAGV